MAQRVDILFHGVTDKHHGIDGFLPGFPDDMAENLADLRMSAKATHAGARALADKIAANSPLAVMGTKRVLEYCQGKSVADGLQYVATWNAAFLASDDLKEAMQAFLEKRPPKFTGR